MGIPARTDTSGDPKRECRCGSNQIQKYRQRISGPLLDRIDIHVEVPLVDYKELSGKTTGEASQPIRERVEAVRATQLARFEAHPDITTNSAMSPRLMKQHCQIDAESSGLLEQAMGELNFYPSGGGLCRVALPRLHWQSARAHDRILKVARTLADLDGNENIEAANLLEAIQYRTLDRNLWL